MPHNTMQQLQSFSLLLRRAILMLGLLTLFLGSAHGQNSTGSINITVTDTSGAAVAGADITHHRR